MKNRIKNTLTIFGTAAVTMAFTLALFGPKPTYADEKSEIKPIIAQPELTVAGCTFTVKLDKETYEAEETPVLTVEATNPGTEAVETSIWISISSTSPADEMSRMISMPAPIWSKECKVTLKAGETQKVILETETKLPAGQSISINMSNQDQTVVMGLARSGKIDFLEPDTKNLEEEPATVEEKDELKSDAKSEEKTAQTNSES